MEYKNEDDLEKLVIENNEILFGKKTIFIPKSKIKTVSLGNSIPDGFLFDLTDPKNPSFYIVEVELYKHDFYRHIFPQITKFIAFFNSGEGRKNLIEKLFNLISENKEIENKFKESLGNREIYKCLNDSIENSQNILLIIDKEKPEIKEAKRAYSEWDKLIRVEVIKKFKINKDEVLVLSPPFEEVEISDGSVSDIVDKEYTENFHLEGANDTLVEIYDKIKEKISKTGKDIRFNPQKYYISILRNKNFAYIQIRKTKIHIVVTLPYSQGKQIIKKHNISKLSEGVQGFYNADCFRVTIEDGKHLNEIIALLKKASKQA